MFLSLPYQGWRFWLVKHVITFFIKLTQQQFLYVCDAVQNQRNIFQPYIFSSIFYVCCVQIVQLENKIWMSLLFLYATRRMANVILIFLNHSTAGWFFRKNFSWHCSKLQAARIFFLIEWVFYCDFVFIILDLFTTPYTALLHFFPDYPQNIYIASCQHR